MGKNSLLLGMVLLLSSAWIPFALASSGSSHPNITSLAQEPQVPPPGYNVNVTTNVVDNYGIKRVVLYASVGRTSWINRTFTLVDGNLTDGSWEATLPSAPLETTVYYFVQAYDILNYTTKSSTQSYTVTKDSGSLGSVTSDFAPRSMMPWDTVNFTLGTIDYASGVKNATLSYAFSHESLARNQLFTSSYVNVTMARVRGDRYNGTFLARIPKVNASTWVYGYYTIFDYAGNSYYGSRYSELLYQVRTPPPPNASVQVVIDNVSSKQLWANVTVSVSLFAPSRYEDRAVYYEVWANDQYHSLQANETRGGRFQYSGTLTFKTYLLGPTELYPFDSYALDVRVDSVRWPVWQNYTRAEPVLLATNLQDYVWNVNSAQPIWHQNGTNPVQASLEFQATLVRKGSTYDYSILLPIFSAFFLLGGTLLIDTEKDLTDRLTIYLAVFVFFLGLFYNIGTLVPVRFNYTFAELLLVALVVDTMILAVMSMLGGVVGHRAIADLLAIAGMLSIDWFILTVQTFYGSFGWTAMQGWQYVLVFSLVYGFALKAFTRSKRPSGP